MKKTLEEIIKGKLPQTKEFSEIKKGFSEEKKYLINTIDKKYLLRESGNDNFINKKKEFDLVRKCFEIDVKCNKPVEIFENNKSVFSLYEYIEGKDGELVIADIDLDMQFTIGMEAGIDLKKINSIKSSDDCDWLERKWKKHEYYLHEYRKMEYKLPNDLQIIDFIAKNYGKIRLENDYFQHDDFHLGNIIISNNRYGGVIDFNRYDWGDPLHEFVKMEVFSHGFSKEFVKGQIYGYFGTNKIDEEVVLTISIYVAMSLFSMVVWTLKNYPKTFPYIEQIINRICMNYSYFNKLKPEWAI